MQNNTPAGRRAAGSHCQAGTPGWRARANLQIKSTANHCWVTWVCDGSTALVSLTALARQGSAAQLELGTLGCGWAAARRPGRGSSLS